MAFEDSCDSFTSCKGDDSMCTEGPIGSTGTCTGWSNDECIYVYYPVTNSVTLSYDDFENGWGSFTKHDGLQTGCDDACRRRDSGRFRDGWSLRIRDNSGAASSIYSSELDIAEYSTLTVNFWYYPDSMDNSDEQFILEYSTDPSDDGSWTSIRSWVKDSDFHYSEWYNTSVQYDVTSINAPIKIRLRCDAGNNYDRIYIDDVIISAI